MATDFSSAARIHDRLSIARLALTGMIVAVTLFLICWIAALIPNVRATHMYIQLFTTAEISSGIALIEGLCWSAIFGSVIGSLIALAYNGLGRISGR